MEILIRVDLGRVSGVLCALALFGYVYNQVVAVAERRKWLEGFVSLAVVLGTLVTLGGLAVVSWEAALLALGCFGASGAPMVVGSIVRYVRLRERERRLLAEEVRGGYGPTGLA